MHKGGPVNDVDQLWTQYFADRSEANRTALAEAYVPLLWKIATNMRNKMPAGVTIEAGDLVGYGYLGLVECIERFDPSRGYQFPTFASLRINGAMRDGIRQEDWVPRLERARQKQGEVTVVGIESTEIPLYETENGRIAVKPLEDRRQIASLNRLHLDDTIKDLCKGLSKKERLVVLLYHVEGLTLKEVGLHLGLTESRVSQMHSDIIKRIRERKQFVVKAPRVRPREESLPPRERVPDTPPVMERCDFMHESATLNLIDLMAEVKPGDLRQEIDKRERELKSLKTILVAIERDVEEPAASKKPAKRPGKPKGETKRTRISTEDAIERVIAIEALLRDKGAMKCAEISGAIGVSYPTTYGYLKNNPQFAQAEGKAWTIRATEGSIA